MIPVATPWIIFLRVFLAAGVTYLAIVDTLKFIWMRMVVRTLSEHTEALGAHTKELKKQRLQNAALIAMLTPPEPPGQVGPQLVKKRNAAIKRVQAESQTALLEEDSADRLAK